jgi:hypothetical protein
MKAYRIVREAKSVREIVDGKGAFAEKRQDAPAGGLVSG